MKQEWIDKMRENERNNKEFTLMIDKSLRKQKVIVKNPENVSCANKREVKAETITSR